MDNSIKSFIIHYDFETYYKKDYYENTDWKDLIGKSGQTIKSSASTPIIRAKQPKIEADRIIKEDIEWEDNYRIVTVIKDSVKIEIHNFAPTQSVPKIKQPMKRSFVLKNDWLRYSKGIAEYAYDNAEGKCVYHQLTEYLINPPGKTNPTKFIDKQRTSEESLFQFFNKFVILNGLWDNDEQEFDLDYGVTTEMIAGLCKEIKRYMYAYDADGKVFHSVTEFSSKNYAPIVFYKVHGHFYLINDPICIRSVAESNKNSGVKIISSTIEEKVDKVMPEVFKMPFVARKVLIRRAQYLKEGLYLLKQSNLDQEILDFITTHKRIPKMAKTRNSNVIFIKFHQGFEETEDPKQQKWVTIAIDATTGEKYEYEDLKRVADANEIEYVNEGIGALILSILKKSKQHPREYLKDAQKQELFESYDNSCACCKLQCGDMEVDHIIPLAGGGSNDMSNLQPLCKDCHSSKCEEEKKLGVYSLKDPEGSTFNKTTLDNVVNTNEYKTWQFVERVPLTGPLKNVFRYDLNKCRRNCAYYNQFEYPVYSVMDIPRPFSGKIRCGEYYVETMNTYPFRGNGWYPSPLVQFGLDRDIIDIENIKTESIPSNKLPFDYFQKPIDTLLKAFEGEPDLQKGAINSMIGLLGRTKHSASSTKFSLCEFQASEWWGEDRPKSNVFIRTLKIDEEKSLYQGIFTEEIQVESTKYPLYRHILALEAIELYKLENILIEKGAVILDRKTDAIGYSSDSIIPVSEYWDESKTVPKYKVEYGCKLLDVEVLPRMMRETKIDNTIFELEWNIQKDYIYQRTLEEEVNRIIESNSSIHIDGAAGTGKSFLTNAIIKELNTRGYEYWSNKDKNKDART